MHDLKISSNLEEKWTEKKNSNFGDFAPRLSFLGLALPVNRHHKKIIMFCHMRLDAITTPSVRMTNCFL